MPDSIYNVLAYAALSFHKNGLNLPHPEQITCRECGQVFHTNWLELRKKPEGQINVTYGGIRCLACLIHES